MMRLQHRFQLEFLNAEGVVIGQRPVDPNLEPVLEWLRLEAERKGYPPSKGCPRDAWVEPAPDAKAGPPRCSGFEAVLDCGEGRFVRALFPVAYFKEEARRGAAHYVEQNQLQAGETFAYRLLALPGAAPTPRAPGAILVDPIEEPYPVESGHLDDLESRSVPFGDITPEQLPVYIPGIVLDQAARQAEAAGKLETGGILIGRLLRDDARGELAVEITAMIPALHVEAEPTRLTFTADTFAAVNQSIAIRDRGEIMLGSAHSHPFLCNPDCPPESRRVCPLMKDFFSEEDIAMHTTVFPKAYTVALVVTVSDEGLRHALFAWNKGVIQQRGFYILNPSRNLPAEAPSHRSSNSSPHHETPCP